MLCPLEILKFSFSKPLEINQHSKTKDGINSRVIVVHIFKY